MCSLHIVYFMQMFVVSMHVSILMLLFSFQKFISTWTSEYCVFPFLGFFFFPFEGIGWCVVVEEDIMQSPCIVFCNCGCVLIFITSLDDSASHMNTVISLETDEFDENSVPISLL